MTWRAAVLVVVWGLVILAFSGCSKLEAGRFGAVSCRPEISACLIFDSATGQFSLSPLPKIPADRGMQEVSK